VDLIIRTVKESPEPVTLVPVGPLTNIAMAFLKAPEIKAKIPRIVLMGGSVGLGNVTPSAEFNI
jgi:inosine-uridine nucleoside N-ribohydrolase